MNHEINGTALMRKNRKKAAAIYLAAGFLALLSAAMFFLPSLSFDAKKIDSEIFSIENEIGRIEKESADNDNSSIMKKKKDLLKQAENNARVVRDGFLFLNYDETVKADEGVYSLSMFTFGVNNIDNVFNDPAVQKRYGKISKPNYVTDGSDYVARGILSLALTAVPCALLAVGAVLAFSRKRAAGVILTIGSAVYTAVSAVWLMFLLNLVPLGRIFLSGSTRNLGKYGKVAYEANTSFLLTPVPFIMLALGIAGLVMASLVRKRYRDLRPAATK